MARLLLLHTLTFVFSTLVYLAAASIPTYTQLSDIDTRLPTHPSNSTARAVKQRRQTINFMTDDSWLRPYAYYASSAYCKPEAIKDWSCGENCEQNQYFTVSAQGGDGDATRYWYVGFDPALNNVIVGRQGTDPKSMMTLLTDANSGMTSLNSTLFPRATFPASMQVHKKFADEHARTIMPIYIAVVNEIVKHMSSHPSVTLLGHSQGAALALLDAAFMVSCKGNSFSEPRTSLSEPLRA